MTTSTDSYPTAAEMRNLGAQSALNEVFRLIKFNSSQGGVQTQPISGEIAAYVSRELVKLGYKVEEAEDHGRLQINWDV